MTNIAPQNPFPERVDTTYDTVIARPRRNRIGERSGERFSEAGLGWQERVAGAFFQGQDRATNGASHQAFEAVVGGQATGRVEPGKTDPNPTWAAVPRESLDSFAGAADFGEPGAVTVPHRIDPRRANTANLAPVGGLARGERQGTTYAAKAAPPAGGRGRRNIADVSDL